MFQKLRAKWKVNGIQLLLILTTFALGGSLCGYAGRKLLGLFAIEQRWLFVILYVLLITLLWPICVLIISIPLGQFGFFRRYVAKIGRKMVGKGEKNTKIIEKRIAIFASGAGSNARKIISHFAGSNVKTVLILCNKPNAGVFDIAATNNIESILINKEQFFRGDAYVKALREQRVDFVILAGFLWKVPAALINAFPNRIVNIHPALLPKYGGKGMYGNFVHQAVIAAGDKESGITIHYVDELYDHGNIILQATCAVEPTDTAAALAQKIHLLEHEHYPKVIEGLLKK